MKKIFNRATGFATKNILWIIIFICSIGFLELAEDVFEREIMDGDIIGYEIMSKYFISESVTPFAKIITEFGGIYVIITATIALILFLKEKKHKILVPINLGIIVLLNQLLKFVLQRPRPTEYRMISETGYSFPSGHSMVSMAFYGYLIYLIYIKIDNKYIKWGLIVFLSILICLIGASRIYLGVHYTSDVLAGFLIAVVYLIMFIKVTEKM